MTEILIETLNTVPWRDVLVLIPAWAAVIVAFLGLATWRKQLYGRVEFELARKVLRSILKYRDALQDVRHPVSFGPLPDSSGEGPTPRDRAVTQWRERWEPVRVARRELEADLVEVEVLWGASEREPFEELFSIENTLYHTLIEHFDSLEPDPDGSLNSPELRKKRRKIMYRSLGESDPLSRELHEKVKIVEAKLLPRLPKRRNRWGIITAQIAT